MSIIYNHIYYMWYMYICMWYMWHIYMIYNISYMLYIIITSIWQQWYISHSVTSLLIQHTGKNIGCSNEKQTKCNRSNQYVWWLLLMVMIDTWKKYFPFSYVKANIYASNFNVIGVRCSRFLLQSNSIYACTCEYV